jgi:hypothetical protein
MDGKLLIFNSFLFSEGIPVDLIMYGQKSLISNSSSLIDGDGFFSFRSYIFKS